MRETEAAAYLGLTVRTLRNYRRKGTLAYREVAGKTRPTIEYETIELERLRQILETQRKSSSKPKSAGAAVSRRITFGLPLEGYAELAAEAQRYGLSVSDYARRQVREKLESRFQAEATELRAEVTRLQGEVVQFRYDFAAGFEAVLEFTGVPADEARQWVRDNLR